MEIKCYIKSWSKISPEEIGIIFMLKGVIERKRLKHDEGKN
jgi:hypothetical protein